MRTCGDNRYQAERKAPKKAFEVKESEVKQEHQAAFDATMSAAGSKATFTGASTSVVSWFLSSEFGMLMGILIGVVGLAVNWYYKHKEDKRRQAEHEQRMGLYE